jgi:transcriptional regulator with XRE-family HTH domain
VDGRSIAAEIRRARAEAGLTQAELARRTGTTQSAVSRLESGRLIPTLAVLERVANATGSTIRVAVGPGATTPAPPAGTNPPLPGAPIPRPRAGAVGGRPLPSAARRRPR